MAGTLSRTRVALLMAGFALHGAARADWTLEHAEAFADGRPLDGAYWQLEEGFLRNREDQYYTPANVAAQGGVLRIEARREQVPNAQWRPGASDWRQARRVAQYTSGALLARRPLQFGRVEVVARTPSGAGVWPAIWLAYEGAGAYGEIDLFEAVGKHPDTVFAGVHHGRDPRTRKHRNDSRVVPGFEGGWHTHTLEWTPARITIALDGQPWFTFDPDEAKLPTGEDPLRLPMRLRINLALGGTWGGAIDDARLPARLDIASLRVWRWTPGEGVAQPAAPVDAAGPAAPAPPPLRWGR
jgi:beta-glucanase (GH16 family)